MRGELTPAQQTRPHWDAAPSRFREWFEKAGGCEKYRDGEMAEREPVGAIGEEGESGVSLLKRRTTRTRSSAGVWREILVVGGIGHAQPRSEQAQLSEEVEKP